MKLFDIDKNWDQIQRYLDIPIIQSALDIGMTLYAETLPCIPGAWEFVRAPWMYSSAEWDKIALERFEASLDYQKWKKHHDKSIKEDEDWYNSNEYESIWNIYHEYLALYYPQPGTPDWYRCYGAEKFLGGFNCALGIRVAPHLKWFIVSGAKHTTAIGYEGEEPVLCFDILAKTDENPEYILGNIRPILFKTTLGEDLLKLHSCLGEGAL